MAVRRSGDGRKKINAIVKDSLSFMSPLSLFCLYLKVALVSSSNQSNDLEETKNNDVVFHLILNSQQSTVGYTYKKPGIGLH